LEGYEVAVRYPGVRVTSEMAERAIAAAGRVRAFTRIKLQLDNPSKLKKEPKST